MSASKKKIRRLTDAQYNEYISALRRESDQYDGESQPDCPQDEGKDDERKHGA